MTAKEGNATFECPTCFRLDTRIRGKEIREEGYSVLMRKCRNKECPPFTTAESVVYDNDGNLAKFNKLAPNKRLADRLRQQRTKGYGGRRTIQVTDSLDIRIRYVKGTGVEYEAKECYRGHAYTEESSYFNKDGRRVCRLCRRMYQQSYIENHGERYKTRQLNYQRRRRERLRREQEQAAA